MRGDIEWGTIGGLVSAAAIRFEGGEAVVDGDVRLTFPGLAAAVDQAARALMAAGVERGDRVAIWAPNIWEWMVAALGTSAAGGVLVPVNTRFKGREAADILERSGARLLFTVLGFLGLDYVSMLHAAGMPTLLERIVVLRGEAPQGTETWTQFLARSDEVSLAQLRVRSQSISGEDLSDIMFTSGTTGRPKGVMTTHAQTLRTFDIWSSIVGLREGDRYLIVNPFFHTFGYKAGFLACLMRGATAVPLAVFDPVALRKIVRRERITVLPGPPTLYQTLLESGGAGGLNTLRLAVTGAASVPVELVWRMRSELGFERVLTAYGLTEATGVVTMCRADDDDETVARTSGRPIPGVEVRVVDEEGKDVAPGEAGEILVRGFNVTAGYYQDPQATADAIDAEGWLRTGDIGTLDERGNVRITDRKKDMFIVGGFNVYPAEIEGELVAHPAVAQAAVVGMPDRRLGEVGCAFVVLRRGARLDPEELISWARERMANYKVPRRVEIVDSLPVNAAGKVAKDELRTRAAS